MNISQTRQKRQRRLHAKLRALNPGKLRLSVHRSNKGIYAQIIDDQARHTRVSVSSRELQDNKGNKTAQAAEIGKLLAQKAIAQKITHVYFDRSRYQYHGRIKALADAARQAGLKF